MNPGSTKTRLQIAAEYGVSTRTLRRWLLRYQVSLPPGLLCPKEQAHIYQALGKPPQHG